MVTPRAAHSELRCRGARVETWSDELLCARIDVHAEEGLHAARAAAALVRQAVLDASARGARSAELTLDVCSPVSGLVLSELRTNLGGSVVEVRLRRAGSTVLADLRFADRPDPRPAKVAVPRGGLLATSRR